MNNKNEYDVVVIGSGNGGLIAATRCAKYGLKTLLVEQHNTPGGFASSFVRGRFEFEPALHELGNLGNEYNQGGLYKIFKDLGIEVEWNLIPEAFHLVCGDKNNQKHFILPFGVEEFARKCDEYVKGSYDKVIKFLSMCEDCYNAVQYITEMKGNPDREVLMKKYPNYLTTATYTLHEVLKKMKMPKEIKYIIESYWIYLGTKPSEIVFQLYAVMFYEYIKYNAYIPTYKSHEISQAIACRFQELGGTIWYNTKAIKIDIQENKVVGLNTTNGYIKTNHIISNVSPRLVFSNMIEKSQLPEYANKLIAKRKPGSQGFCIYLGLNKTVEELGFKDYSFFVYSSMDHNKIAKNMESIENNNDYIVVALNVANKDASPQGTSILSFTTLFEDAWNDVDVKDYFKIKNEIAKRFIEDFEQRMNVNIKPYIEEIEVATPVTFARYTGTANGAIYGNKNSVNDSPYVRGRNMNNFDKINGLIFCGGNSYFTHGYSITYASGNTAANRTYGKIMESKRGKNNG